MKTINFFFITILLTFYSAAINAQVNLVDLGASWKYFDQAAEPNPQGNQDWFENGFDDSDWDIGPAQLGYGDQDESTLINNNTKTAYFRHEFNFTNPQNIFQLNLQLVYDDGAVIYINGTEWNRINMPAGDINYSTFASGGSGDDAVWTDEIDPALFNNGTNLIAVEIHQVSNTSSDISFDFKLVGYNDLVINRGPYLQQGSSDRMIVKWRTTLPATSVLNYGTNLNNLAQSVSDGSLKTEHEIEINGLTANTKYFYEIDSQEGILKASASNLYFQTSPPEGSDQPITAWILGDCGTGNDNARAVRDAYYNFIGNEHTDMILFLGDNAYNTGTDEEYQNAIFENMYEEKLQNTVSWSTLGNHDGHSADSDTQSGPYYDIFSFPTNGECGGLASGTEAYYSFDYANIHFIVLESYETNKAIGGAMYNWAENDIQNTLADWIVAFWHHPPYTKGSHDSDTEFALVQMRENFLPMLEENGIDLVLSGHSHSYERSYYINSHYSNSDSFDPVNHTVGFNGDGNGRIDGDGAYSKENCPSNPLAGTVYITAGSSGKITNAALDHKAMFYSAADLGSTILTVDGDEMNVKFLRENGAIDDYFTIIKPQAQANCESNLVVNSKVFLQGPYNSATGLMNDDLRQAGFIPLTQPYSALGSIPYNGTEQTTQAVLNVSGPAAIVDWILVELRSVDNPQNIVARRAALLRRDGKIVDTDGISNINFLLQKDNYHLAIHHRNHLAVMTANTFMFCNASTFLDFSEIYLNVYGTNPLAIGDVKMMWAGNADSNGEIIFQGGNNDSNTVFFEVLNASENPAFATNYIYEGYSASDVNMDGQVIYQGANNDANVIFFNILNGPGNVNFSSNYILYEQLP